MGQGDNKGIGPSRFGKTLIKHAIRAAAGALSRNALDTVLDEFCVVLGSDARRRRSRFRMLSRLAEDAHVVSLSVDGAYGVMQSSVRDLNVLYRYSVERRFADRTTQLIAAFFGDGPGSYVDIGANIGMTLVPIAQNYRVHCLAFEPEPTNFVNLARNVAANCPHGNVVLNQIALYTESTNLLFELSENNLGDHRIISGSTLMAEQNRRVIKVDARPLDESLDGLRSPLAIKIDTQGAEPFVFAGGRSAIPRADLVVFEFWPYSMQRMGGDVDGMLDLLNRSFATIALAEHEEGEISEPMAIAVGCDKLRAVYSQRAIDPHWYCDVIARK